MGAGDDGGSQAADVSEILPRWHHYFLPSTPFHSPSRQAGGYDEEIGQKKLAFPFHVYVPFLFITSILLLYTLYTVLYGASTRASQVKRVWYVPLCLVVLPSLFSPPFPFSRPPSAKIVCKVRLHCLLLFFAFVRALVLLLCRGRVPRSQDRGGGGGGEKTSFLILFLLHQSRKAENKVDKRGRGNPRRAKEERGGINFVSRKIGRRGNERIPPSFSLPYKTSGGEGENKVGMGTSANRNRKANSINHSP